MTAKPNAPNIDLDVLRERLFRGLEKPEHIKAAEEIMETVEDLLAPTKAEP